MDGIIPVCSFSLLKDFTEIRSTVTYTIIHNLFILDGHLSNFQFLKWVRACFLWSDMVTFLLICPGCLEKMCVPQLLLGVLYLCRSIRFKFLTLGSINEMAWVTWVFQGCWCVCWPQWHPSFVYSFSHLVKWTSQTICDDQKYLWSSTFSGSGLGRPWLLCDHFPCSFGLLFFPFAPSKLTGL